MRRHDLPTDQSRDGRGGEVDSVPTSAVLYSHRSLFASSASSNLSIQYPFVSLYRLLCDASGVVTSKAQEKIKKKKEEIPSRKSSEQWSQSPSMTFLFVPPVARAASYDSFQRLFLSFVGSCSISFIIHRRLWFVVALSASLFWVWPSLQLAFFATTASCSVCMFCLVSLVRRAVIRRSSCADHLLRSL